MNTETVIVDRLTKPPCTFSDYSNAITQFRKKAKLDTPSETELKEWEKEWATWTKKRRQSEMISIESHLAILSF